jgi:N-methylhydantoinase A
MSTRVGVDVGGTFTDLVAEVDGRVVVAKVPSTPDDQARGILAAVARAGVDPATVDRFAHGTTVATNTVLERDGARTVLVTTAGVPDLLHVGRQTRPALYDLGSRRPAPLVEREDVVEAVERLGADGEVVVALTDAEVARVTAAVVALDPEAVALCLLFPFLDDSHEQRLATALRAALGDGVPVSVSSEVLPTFREVERASTTVLNAAVAPRMARYLGSLADQLSGAGLAAPVEVMRSGGGTFTAATAARRPVETLLSGPAAGAWGAAAVGVACGAPDLLGLDMGGTSSDVTLVRGGRPRTTAHGAVDGLPFAVPTTDVHTVGAGGGSIAWFDAGGGLRVGPRSAGAEPGPAAYGHGGIEPTVTDANVVLGRLPADVRLGGSLALDGAAAAASLAAVAERLGGTVERAAAGVLEVVEAQMVRALRVVSVEQGHDPRELVLVPFGGAGPLHQAALADGLGVRRVLVPPNPGVLCALGLLAAPVTADALRTHLHPLSDVPASALRAWIEELDGRAGDQLREQRATITGTATTAGVRYRGQAHELDVPVPDGADPDDLAHAFHAAHRDRFGYDQPDTAVELVTLAVRATGPAPSVPLPRWTAGGAVDDATLRSDRRDVDGTTLDVPLLDRPALAAGATFTGPAVVAGLDATTWVAPWQTATVGDHAELWLEES